MRKPPELDVLAGVHELVHSFDSFFERQRYDPLAEVECRLDLQRYLGDDSERPERD